MGEIYGNAGLISAGYGSGLGELLHTGYGSGLMSGNYAGLSGLISGGLSNYCAPCFSSSFGNYGLSNIGLGGYGFGSSLFF